jgi:hypothetical protein
LIAPLRLREQVRVRGRLSIVQINLPNEQKKIGRILHQPSRARGRIPPRTDLQFLLISLGRAVERRLWPMPRPATAVRRTHHRVYTSRQRGWNTGGAGHQPSRVDYDVHRSDQEGADDGGPGREDNIWPDDVHSNKPHQQYSDFLKSKMYRNDRLLVTCSDCHLSRH